MLISDLWDLKIFLWKMLFSFGERFRWICRSLWVHGQLNIMFNFCSQAYVSIYLYLLQLFKKSIVYNFQCTILSPLWLNLFLCILLFLMLLWIRFYLYFFFVRSSLLMYKNTLTFGGWRDGLMTLNSCLHLPHPGIIGMNHHA